MKVIFVCGDDDYDASSIESMYKPTLETWEKIKEDGFLLNEDEEEIRCEALEFEEVDKEFIKFVWNEIQDYDDSKTKNFFIVDEE